MTTLQQIVLLQDEEEWARRHVLIDMSVMKNRPSDADLALAYRNAQALSFHFFWIKNKIKKTHGFL
jgi:hypothetical protein